MNITTIENKIANLLASSQLSGNLMEFSSLSKTRLLEKNEYSNSFLLEHSPNTQNKPIQNSSYIEAFQTDMDSLQAHDFPHYIENFEAIVAHDFFEFLRFPEAKLLEYLKFLKKDASFYFFIPNLAHISLKLHLLDNTFVYQKNSLLCTNNIHLFTYKTVAVLLSQANLLIEHIDFFTLEEEDFLEESCQLLEKMPPLAAKALVADNNGYVSHFFIKAKQSDLGLEPIYEHNFIALHKTHANSSDEMNMQKVKFMQFLANREANHGR